MAPSAARSFGDTGSKFAVVALSLALLTACGDVGALPSAPDKASRGLPATAPGEAPGTCEIGACTYDGGTVATAPSSDGGTTSTFPTGPVLYVATTGSDGNPGTVDKPLRTFARAGSLAKPGTTVLIRGGKFTVNQTVVAHGTADAPIVFEPYPGEQVFLDGTNVWLSTSSALLYVNGSQYVTLRGLDVSHSNMRGIDIYNSHDVRVEGFNIHDMTYSAISGESDNMTFDGNTISNAQLVTKNTNPTAWGSGLATWLKSDGTWVKNLTVTNNTIHDVWGECMIALFVDTATIRGNRIHDCWSMNLYLDHVRNVTVDRNFLYATTDAYNRPTTGTRATGLGLAIEPDNGATSAVLDGIIVTNNLVLSTGLGVSFWGQSGNWDATNTYRNVKVENNVVYNNARGAISFDAVISGAASPSGNTVRNNVLYGGRLDGVALKLGNASGWLVQNNDFPAGIPSGYSNNGNFMKWPSFANPAALAEPSAFELQSGSACIATGLGDGEARQDFWGVQRSASHPSVGIHEPQ